MPNENSNFFRFYELVSSNLEYMKYSKNEKQTQKDYIRERLEGLFEKETLENDIFLRFHEIGWQNCEDKAKAIKELDKYLDEIKEKFYHAEILDKVTIAYQLFTDIPETEFKNSKHLKDNFIKALKLIALKRTASFMSSNKNEKIFDLVPIERKFDEFGTWELDRLFGHMKIFIILPRGDGKDYDCFPLLWRTDAKTQFIVKEKSKDDLFLSATKSRKLTLNHFIEKEFRDRNESEQIIKLLNSKSIFTIDSLTEIRNWSDFTSYIPAHVDKLKNATERYKNSNIESTKTQIKKTKAEIMADWNKVKLFIFYDANLMNEYKKYGLLDKTALSKGFEEQRKDPEFDGGP
ncbi:hypothetical protein BpHYR1_049988, partial [Brachionus plicatilis]